MKYILTNNRPYKVYTSGRKVRVTRKQYDNYIKYRRNVMKKKKMIGGIRSVKDMVMEKMTETLKTYSYLELDAKDKLFTYTKEIFSHIISNSVYPSILEEKEIKKKINSLFPLGREMTAFDADSGAVTKALQIIRVLALHQRSDLRDYNVTDDVYEAEQWRLLYKTMCLMILSTDVAKEVVMSVIKEKS